MTYDTTVERWVAIGVVAFLLMPIIAGLMAHCIAEIVREWRRRR